MPNVYFPQQPVRKVAGTCGPVFMPLYDTSPAEEFGKIVTVLPNGVFISDDHDTMKIIKDRLATFGDDDYLVAIGDPAAIAMSVMCASRVNNGRVKLLRWNKWNTSYQMLQITLEN